MDHLTRWRVAPVVLLAASVVAASVGAACTSTSTTANGTGRTVVVLTADRATQIVVPAGFATATTSLPTADPEESQASAPATSSSDMTSSSEATAPETTSTVIGGADEPVADDPLNDDPASDDPVADDQAGEGAEVEVVTTTVVEVVKETVPLAEEDVNSGVKLLGALDEFNGCLASEGHEWIGLPDAAQGPDAPVNQPGYLQALQLCNSRTGISEAFQDFQASRSDLTPEDIRRENEDFLDLVDCLRGLGWQVGELRPDADGLLQPGDEFSGPDGGFATNDIRDCVSEIALVREDGE